MATRVIAVKVESPGTHEQHITYFKLDNNEIFPKISMILLVEMCPDDYHTFENNKRANLEIAVLANGTRYLKTEPDNTTKNNLLNLPRFI